MKARRKWIFALLGVMVLAAIVVGAALSRGAQTWVARRYLSAHPELGATLGSLRALPGRVELTHLQVVHDGYSVSIPALEADLPVLAAIRGNLAVTRLVAKGLTVDLTRVATTPAGPAGPALATSILGRLQLPVDLALDGVTLEGEVVFPAAAGEPPVRTRLAITGGKIAAGRTGQLDFSVAAALPRDAAVSAVEFNGRAAVTMSTPREFSSVEVNLDASARGPRLPQGATLAAALTATRANSGEDYSISLESGGRRVVIIRALQPAGAAAGNPLRGAWSLNLADADVSPFTLGRALPQFRVTGGGRLEADSDRSSMSFDGQAELSVSRLAAVDARLAPLGPLNLAGTFDVRRSVTGWEVRRLALDLAGTGPILALRAVQPFEFNPAGSLLKVTDRDRDLVAVEVRGLPLAWAQLGLPAGWGLAGGDLRGALALAARDDSFSLRTTVPLTAPGVAVTQGPARRFGPADLSLRMSGEYSVQGWTIDVHDLTARSGGTAGLMLTGSMGRLAGSTQPLQVKGTLTSDLPGLLAQAGLNGAARLSGGRATGDFRAIFGNRRDVEAHLAVTELVALPGVTREVLPTVGIDLRANWEGDGRVELRMPVTFARGGRTSDLNLTGFVSFGADGLGLDAKAASEVFVVDDARVLSVLAAAPDPSASGRPTESGPFWRGLTGRVGLDFREVLDGAGQRLQDVTGTLRLEPAAFRLDDAHAVMSRSGEVKLAAGLNFEPKATEPYTLKADGGVTDLESAAWLLALNPGRAPAVEGRFSISGQLTAAARTPAELPERIEGKLRFVSKGGLSRLLRTNVADQVKGASTTTSVIARVGSLVRSESLENAANRSQNVVEAARTFNEVKFDQMVVEVTRGPDLDLKLSEFSLFSPELRLTGSGVVRHGAGVPWSGQELSLRLQLLAQGQTGRLLGRAGLLVDKVDPMGFSPFLVPFTLEGTLGEPAANELAAALLKAANGSLLDNLRGK
jgi:hypothetical protein